MRSRGSLIRGTNGLSNGIVPWLKTLDASVAAVNQGGRRKGAACVYLETWHADIEEFLELRDGTGDEARRVRHVNLANWVPDLFMERVEKDWMWSLFDPKVVPHLVDLHGEEFERAYQQAESRPAVRAPGAARQLYARMMRTLAETGNGWMTFKDAANRTLQPGRPTPRTRVVHLSNLCTEILEVSSDSETAVCNLGSINLGRTGPTTASFDFEPAGRDRAHRRCRSSTGSSTATTTRRPAPPASNARWRPVGLGVMGLQDVFFQLGLPFDSDEARALSRRISEEIYLHALWASTELAEASGPHEAFAETHAAAGRLQFDLWGVELVRPGAVGADARSASPTHGLRNSLLIAIAPPPPSPPSPAATSASSPRCRTCSSARRSRASSSR